jgi:hypothetical protein
MPSTDTVLDAVCFGYCTLCADSSYNNQYYFIQWTVHSTFVADDLPTKVGGLIDFPADSISVFSVSEDANPVVQFKIFSTTGRYNISVSKFSDHQAYQAVEKLKDLYHNSAHSLTNEYTVKKMQVNGESQPAFYSGNMLQKR